jgi:hypothetical protein
MNKRLQVVLMIINAVGYVMLVISRVFKNSINDFALGVVEGMAIAFIIIGFSYLCWCIIHKKNPYVIQKDN